MNNFDRKFNLGVAFWFSVSLTTPVIHGMGFAWPGLFARSLLTAVSLAAFTLFIAYPVLIWALPLSVLVLSALAWLTFPVLLAKIALAVYQAVTTSYMFYPVVIITSFSLVVLLIVTRIKKTLPILLASGTAVFVPLWYLYVDSAYPAAISYALCWLILLSYKKGQALWVAAGSGEKELRNSWLTYTASVLLTSLFMAVILPKGFGPLPLDFLHSWADARFPFLDGLRGWEARNVRGSGEEFSLYDSGLRETSRLGGPLREDSTVMLEVRGNGAGLYLRGTVKYIYTGYSWLKSGQPEIWEPPPIGEELGGFMEPVQVWIKHRRLHTTTVFTLLHTLEMTGFSRPLLKGPGDDANLPGAVPRNREYRVKGLKLAYRDSFSPGKEPDTGLEPFLELPPHLPARVKELALEIAGGKDAYTGIKALESYLRNNYPYNKNTAVLPENREFVDFFLFEQKDGYCTYFATALAVMARAVGIPTRYVEGFMVPGSPHSNHHVYRVAGTNAHAWVEAYIPGTGWLTFEATPGFPTSDSLPLRREQQAEAPAITPQNGAGPAGDATRSLIPDEGEGYSSNPEKTAALSLLNSLLAMLLAALPSAALILASLMLYRWLQVRKNMHRLNLLPPRLRALGYYTLTLSLLDRLGLGKYPGETPGEYSERIYRRVYSWNISFKELSAAISYSLYSGKEEAPPLLAEQMEAFYLNILDRYFATVGKVTAFIEIYLQRKLHQPWWAPGTPWSIRNSANNRSTIRP